MTLRALAPGVLKTTMPFSAQEVRGMLLTPAPARATARRFSGNADLDAKFVKAAEAAGFVNLKGHRSVGGMRASIYNAMPIEGVQKLVDFMEQFEKENR